jgi:hypothetical protein
VANFYDTVIRNSKQASGTSTVIPLFLQCGTGGYGPVNFFGGIIAGSVAGGTGGSVTTQGVCTSISFNGVNFYADNGTQAAYTFFPNGSTTGLAFRNCAILNTAAVMAAITGDTYASLDFEGNTSFGAIFAPPVGNNGTVISSHIDAHGGAINLGASGSITHSVMLNPGTITAGTNTSNGSF